VVFFDRGLGFRAKDHIEGEILVGPPGFEPGTYRL
jgi:hypothetical protein